MGNAKAKGRGRGVLVYTNISRKWLQKLNFA
jgi:hypothetical protein